MEVREDGSVILLREWHLENASFPMEVREDGSVILFRDSQP